VGCVTPQIVVCVLKSHLPQRGMDAHQAEALEHWAAAEPEPYVGLHRPKIER
jgi:hypothetical protein